MLTFRGMGAERVAWHTHLADPVDRALTPAVTEDGEVIDHDWNLFSTMGLHNDIFDSAQSRAPFTAASDGWRRPAWLSLQRLNEVLLPEDAVPEVVFRTNKCMVVRVQFARALWVDGEPWDRAYVMWLDETASRAEHTFRFVDPERTGAVFYSLVPETTVATLDPTPVGGYAPNTEPDWAWPGWNQATLVEGAPGYLEVTILRAEPTTNPAPTCLLTNAVLWG